MTKKEQLYDAFGELVYVLAMADGQIQPEEIQQIKQILEGHLQGAQIQWSFDYEAKKHRPVEEVYEEVIDTCRQVGPDPEYLFLIDLLEKVAAVYAGKDRQEDQVIQGFTSDLIERFRKDLEAIE
ncbi:MAG: TerB family tellurite resistance protein [Haliscomenobacteraceae bacterium CHB4]|nr:hypothetical protein [Saprospiraceae bacterium]MCE7924060.1 TerB family tellurite resistance protein [Haliscomenobacteraceae bacterium CHB4]